MPFESKISILAAQSREMEAKEERLCPDTEIIYKGKQKKIMDMTQVPLKRKD